MTCTRSRGITGNFDLHAKIPRPAPASKMRYKHAMFAEISAAGVRPSMGHGLPSNLAKLSGVRACVPLCGGDALCVGAETYLRSSGDQTLDTHR